MSDSKPDNIHNDVNVSVASDVDVDSLPYDDSETNSDVEYAEYNTDDEICATVEPLIKWSPQANQQGWRF